MIVRELYRVLWLEGSAEVSLHMGTDEVCGMKIIEWSGKQATLALYQLEGGTADELHDHGDFFQVSVPLVGRPRIQQGAETRWLDPDLRAVTAPGEQHRNLADEGTTRLLLLSMRQEFLEQVYRETTGHEGTALELAAWVEGSSEGLKRHAIRTLGEMAVQPLETLETDEMEWQWAEMFLSLHRGTHTERWQQADTRRPHHPAVVRVVAFFRESFASEVTLEQMVQVSGISKTHLFRLFREELGCSPSQVLQNVRLRQAEEMISRTGLDVTEVAFATGFGSLSTFERAFKRAYGLSAGNYRRSKK